MRIERRAAYLVERIEDAEFTVGKHPAGVAAACLYTAASRVRLARDADGRCRCRRCLNCDPTHALQRTRFGAQ
jgi:transcription initiation factor TFIIIB Brf1 subunit/transcription initiation factor TFIIB